MAAPTRQRHDRKGGAIRKPNSRRLIDKGDTYKNILGQLERFLTLIGDYESLSILSDRPPTGCISMSAESVRSFLHYKYGPKDTPLIDSQNRPVKAKCDPKDPQARPVNDKSDPKHTPLVDAAERDVPLVDAAERDVSEKPLAEKPLMCSGAWTSPKKMNQLNSAVKLMHLAMGQRGQ